MTKDEILKKMSNAFEMGDYQQAYIVYRDNKLDYPITKDFHKREEQVKASFRGTLAEIENALEKAQQEDKEEYLKKRASYDKDEAEIRNALMELAVYEGLPEEVSTNRDFVNAISYYAITEDEPYNWVAEFSEFWDCYIKANRALQKV